MLDSTSFLIKDIACISLMMKYEWFMIVSRGDEGGLRRMKRHVWNRYTCVGLVVNRFRNFDMLYSVLTSRIIRKEHRGRILSNRATKPIRSNGEWLKRDLYRIGKPLLAVPSIDNDKYSTFTQSENTPAKVLPWH